MLWKERQNYVSFISVLENMHIVNICWNALNYDITKELSENHSELCEEVNISLATFADESLWGDLDIETDFNKGTHR